MRLAAAICWRSTSSSIERGCPHSRPRSRRPSTAATAAFRGDGTSRRCCTHSSERRTRAPKRRSTTSTAEARAAASALTSSPPRSQRSPVPTENGFGLSRLVRPTSVGRWMRSCRYRSARSPSRCAGRTRRLSSVLPRCASGARRSLQRGARGGPPQRPSGGWPASSPPRRSIRATAVAPRSSLLLGRLERLEWRSARARRPREARPEARLERSPRLSRSCCEPASTRRRPAWSGCWRAGRRGAARCGTSWRRSSGCARRACCRSTCCASTSTSGRGWCTTLRAAGSGVATIPSTPRRADGRISPGIVHQRLVGQLRCYKGPARVQALVLHHSTGARSW
mmetsp:Transcript_43512/g.141581  ORF Transcript_43512/g.141581 Transcript_43512/m.141581 type:complete len:339 (+) Transcript_43512:273-1289(+)